MALKSTSAPKQKKAPEFKLADKDGALHALKDFKGQRVVLFFYPKDNTPGCTVESVEFSENLKMFKKLKAAVIGISGGDEKSKLKFCEKNNLKVLLLSDTDFAVSKQYRVYGEKSFMGRKFLGIHRTTFVIGKTGKIERTFEKVTPKGHANEIMAYLKESE